MLNLVEDSPNRRAEMIYGTHSRCSRCQRGIMWMITYRNGKPLPFDMHPLPTRYDVERIGWAPCTMAVAGRQRRCMAPRSLHPPHSRPANVLTLHECLRAAA